MVASKFKITGFPHEGTAPSRRCLKVYVAQTFSLRGQADSLSYMIKGEFMTQDYFHARDLLKTSHGNYTIYRLERLPHLLPSG